MSTVEDKAQDETPFVMEDGKVHSETIKITRMKGHRFYQQAVKSFFEGDEEKKRHKHEELKLSAYGTAINVAIGVASAMEREGIASVKSVQTKYLQGEGAMKGRSSAGIVFTLWKTGFNGAGLEETEPESA